MSAENVKVVCRVRPLNDKEKGEGGIICVKVPEEKTIQLLDGGKKSAGDDRTFVFDRTFDWNCTQRQVYDFAARPIIESVLRGFNGTVLAYGQTSSGKTHTMQGVIEDQEQRGIIPRMVNTIFEGVDAADEHIEFTVKVAILEIYMEKIRDLLDPSKDNLKVHEDKVHGIYVGDITEEYVTCEQDVFDIMRIGQENRSVAATNMNAHSSRSHLVFILSISQRNLHDLSVKVGKLYLVDLAGSEKVAKTGAAGSTLDEAKMINKSLSALGNVINALTDPKTSHVPYRDSKLTRILQESLGGNSKTCLIITASPSSYNEAETLSTLRFGWRAKQIKNVAKVNQERSVEELKMLLEKAERTIEEQKGRIRLLEETLRTNGITVPGGISKAPAAEAAAAASGMHHSKSEKTFSKPPKPEEEADEESEFLQLMEELYQKKAELKEQSEAITELNRHVQSVNEQQKTVEAENQILVNRIADLSVTCEQLQYERQEQLDTIQQLEASRKAVESELKVLQDSQKNLLAQISEKDKEIDSMAKAGAVPTIPEDRVADMPKVAAAGSSEIAKIREQLLGQEGASASEELAGSTDAAAAGGELSKQMHELQKFKLSALAQMEQLKKQNDDLRKGVYGKGDGAWAKEREAMLADMQREQEQVADLKVMLLEERKKAEDLKEMLKDGERPLRRKVSQLDRNLEQLTIMYHKLVSQNSGLKVECQVNDKKIQRKEQRIAQLERNLKEAKAKYEKLLQQCANLTNTVEHMYRTGTIAGMAGMGAGGAAAAGAGSSAGGGAIAPGSARRANIARPLKGGSHRVRRPTQAREMGEGGEGDESPFRGGITTITEEGDADGGDAADPEKRGAGA